MEEAVHSPRLVRFGTFEVDLPAGELRKGGVKLKLTGQPFQVLAILLERPGEVVTREELQKRLWPDTFVDVDHNLNTAINKIREVLGDSAESPRFVETLPRRGYRFIAPVEGVESTEVPGGSGSAAASRECAWVRRTVDPVRRPCVARRWRAFSFTGGCDSPAPSQQRALTRLTFDDGLQIGATWSPDGRFIAYSSDRGGKFDIWVQQVSGGDPVQITKGPGHNWQPDWSPDGKYIAYRSEERRGRIVRHPALGGAGLERKIASFGYYPRWSPDSSQMLFQTSFHEIDWLQPVLHRPNWMAARRAKSWPSFWLKRNCRRVSAAWYPDGKRITVWVADSSPTPSILDSTDCWWTWNQARNCSRGPEGTCPGFRRQWSRSTVGEYSFSWSPSGDAIYFERGYRGARNIWKLTSRSRDTASHEHRSSDHRPGTGCRRRSFKGWQAAGVLSEVAADSDMAVPV